MAKILFGYRNLVGDADNIYSGDEAGDHVDDNLSKPHPNSFWRADDLTASHVTFRFDDTNQYPVQLVALLYSTAGVARNLLGSSNNLSDTTHWSNTNALTSRTVGVAAPVAGAAVWEIQASGAGSVQHYWGQSHDLARATSKMVTPSIQKGASVYAKRLAVSANLELEIGWNNRAETASIEVDLSDGSINTTNASANVVIDSTSVTDAGSGWYLVKLTATASVATASSNWKYDFRMYCLDSAFANTYTQAGEIIQVVSPRLVFGTAESTHEITVDPGGRWKYSADTSLPVSSNPNPAGTWEYESGWLHVGSSANLEVWSDSLGWAHSWFIVPAAGQSNYKTHILEVYCDNASGQADLSNIYLGPYYQPSHGLADPADFKESLEETIRESEAGGGQEYRGGTAVKRIWTIRLPFATQAEAEGELHDLGIKLGRTQPVVVIRDPDETAYGQQHILYGYVDVWDRVGQWLNADGTLRYTVTMTLRELLP